MIVYIVRGLVNMMLIWTSNVFFQIRFFITNGLKQAKQNFYSFKLISHLIFFDLANHDFDVIEILFLFFFFIITKTKSVASSVVLV